MTLTATIHTEDKRSILVTGIFNRADPDRFIWEDYIAIERAELDGVPVDLTDHQWAQAKFALADAHEAAKAEAEDARAARWEGSR